MSGLLVGNADPAAVLLHGPGRRPPTTEPVGEITFHHPGYTNGSGILFSLPRLDRSSAYPHGGVHYGTALTACQIVANNSFCGYLATDRQGSQRIDPGLDRDHLLTLSDYWFIVPMDMYLGPNPPPYPVVPSFQDWVFPHWQMPDWPKPKNPPGVNIDDSRCIVTRVGGLTDSCDLIPAADGNWFQANHMARWYGKQTEKITLRHDLRFAFDSHLFAVVPKKDGYVVHQFYATNTFENEFASAFHNHVVLPPPEVTPQFLFARFARAVLMLAKAFVLHSGVSRNVLRFFAVYNRDHQNVGFLTNIEWLSPQQLAYYYGGGVSPTKRRRNDGLLVDNRPEHTEDDDHANDESNNNGSDTDGEGRGRPRKRRRDDSEPPSLSSSVSSVSSGASLVTVAQ